MSYELPLTDVVVPESDVQAVLDALRSGWLTMGPRSQAFEEAFAAAVGARHAVAVSSGTAALHVALLAAGIGPGDEVVVPALTFVAAAGAVRACGAVPVLCDVIGAEDLNLDPADVERRLTPRTRAILATHWWGYPCDLERLGRTAGAHGLLLIEDAAQAVLARPAAAGDRTAGTVGHAGCFSFFSKKQLCVGEGGMVVSDDEELATRARLLRSHAMTSVTWDRHRGHAETYDVVDVGFNYRLDEPRAALGLARLPRLVEDIERRRAMARAYRARLEALDGVQVPWDDDAVERSSHFAFGVVLPDGARRDAVRAGLRERGIQTTAYPAISTFTEYADGPSLPVSEDIAARHLALPLASTWGEPEVERVVQALGDVLA